MGRTDENNPGVIGPGNVQGGFRMGRGKVAAEPVQHRRALSNVNRNIVGVPPYPCAVKRGLTEKHGVSSVKNQAPPPNRPVTRKFAAQLAQHCTEPTRRDESDSEDCTIIDVEEYSMSGDGVIDVEEYSMSGDGDSSVPMYVKHTEAMMDEIDLMDDEEVEMEDVIPESVMDIDCADKNNPLAVVEYIDDIYSHYRRTESTSCVSPNYMAHQNDINERMRAILIDWLIEVHYKFELMEETLYLTVNLIDRFLERKVINRKKLQLVGVTAMLLACKYEEVSVPVVDDLIVISDRAYSRKEVLDMETLIVNTLQFNMSAPTPYVFMRRFLKAAQADKKLELLSYFMIELSLVEYEMLMYSPSLLAAAAIYTAQCIVHKAKHWNKTCAWYTAYPEDQLLECAQRMVSFHHKSGTGKLTGVHKKYSTSKFGYVARSEAAEFLLEN